METDVNINRLRSYANILSNSSINGIVREGNFRYLKAKIKKYDNNHLQEEGITYKEYFAYLFEELKSNYRYEYIYKNTIINKILLGEYSLNSTCALNEFRINKSIADLVLINGTSKVFEIKTELDSPNRLLNQIQDYKKVFKEIYLVTHHSLQKRYLEIINDEIGLMVLTKDFSLKTIREPKTNLKLDNLSILKCLRKSEYSNVIISYFGSLPIVTDFKFYNTCKTLFEDIPSEILHDLMMIELKKRNIKEKEILASSYVPEELKHICLCLNFNKNEYKMLNDFLRKKLIP